MGWTGYYCTRYKNGKVDVKGELDSIANWTKESGYYHKVLKSSMVGSVYYAAIEIGGADEPRRVFAMICRTSTTWKDGCNLFYKYMSEDMGPNEDKCPESILNLLTDTEYEAAKEWKERCRKYHEKRKLAKKDKYSLKNLPVGSTIDFMLPYDTNVYGRGDYITLKKRIIGWKYVFNRKTGAHERKDNIVWTDGHYRWKEKIIPENYRVLLEHEIIDAQSRRMIASGEWAAV